MCFVVHEAGVERRDVKLGEVTLHMTEVTDGLREGEQVVLNPQVAEVDFAPSSTPADVAGMRGHSETPRRSPLFDITLPCETSSLVPTLGVGMPSGTLCVRCGE